MDNDQRCRQALSKTPEMTKHSSDISETDMASSDLVPNEDIDTCDVETRRKEMAGQWFRLSDSCSVALHQGDITKWSVDGRFDAIVNAANTGMLGCGGVDGAIHRAAGLELLEECRSLKLISKGVRCNVGDAVITNAYHLPVSKIIHTIGPIYKDQETSAPILESAYKSTLSLAIQEGIKYIVFPAISCCIYGYPYDGGAEVALRTVRRNFNGLNEVHFVFFESGSWSSWVSRAREEEKVKLTNGDDHVALQHELCEEPSFKHGRTMLLYFACFEQEKTTLHHVPLYFMVLLLYLILAHHIHVKDPTRFLHVSA